MSRDRSVITRGFLIPAARFFGRIALIISSAVAAAQPLTSLELPLVFEPYRGRQWSEAQFLARTPGANVFLTAKGPVFALVSGESFRMRLVGAKPVRLEGRGLQPGKLNYFIGDDPSAWRTGIPIYRQVASIRALPGVDLIFYGSQRQLEYDLRVAPGADPRAIRWVFEGTSGLRLDSDGSLVVAVGGAEVRQARPRIFQSLSRGRQREVSGEYVITGENEVAFRLGDYDRAKALTIDPVLVFSTYLGGRRDDQGLGIAVDPSGAVYITGVTTSDDFPNATGTQRPSRWASDAFVAKLNPAGTAIVYATYLGGSGSDSGNAIAVDASGNAYVAGDTQSADFPTLNPIQSTIGGSRDVFVTKLSPTGILLYSTYLGGSLQDSASGIAVDSAGSAYICGETRSSNFPTRAPIQALNAGGVDGFVAKLAPSGSQLVYSTYLGGSRQDRANAIAVDASGAAYLAGDTTSTNFPVVAPLQSGNAGKADVFVSKLNPNGSALVYSTYFGGSGTDSALGIAIDGSGRAVVVGYSWSALFPTTAAAVQGGNAGYGDAFAFKLASDGGSAIYSTLFGGEGDDWANAVTLDTAGNAYIGGVTSSPDFPAVNAIEPNLGATYNAFVTAIDPLGTAFLYSTFLGGSGSDQGTAIALDFSGNVYLTGITTSANYPSVAALQTSNAGGDDVLVSKLAPTKALPLSSIDPASGSGFRRRTVAIRGSGFVAGATVSFGGVASRSVTVVNPNLVIATTPPHSPGLVDVVVANPDGTAGTFHSGFEFVEPDRGGCQSTAGSNPFGVILSAALILVWRSRSRKPMRAATLSQRADQGRC
jgi:Beta-propeller repeat/IPT/TIG domain